MRCLLSRVEPAGSVTAELARDISQLITTIAQGKFEGSYAQRATRRSASSETTPSGLTRQRAIYEIRQHEQYWANATGPSGPTTNTRGE